MFRSKQQILTIALIAIGISLYLGLKPLFEFLPNDSIGRETIAAVIGAILITLVTQMLLTSQQNIEQQNKKDDEIFKARLLLYQNFIQQFFDNISHRKLTEPEHKKLKGLLFRIYAVGGPETIAELDKLVTKIETLVTDEDTDIEEQEVEKLEIELRHLAKSYLRHDLIGKKMEVENEGQNTSETIIVSNAQNIDAQQRGDKKRFRNTDKIEYAKRMLSKTDFVLEVFRDNIKNIGGSSLTYEKFEEFMQQKRDKAGLDKYEEKHFDAWRAMPIWTTFERASEIKQKSREGERWKRYRMEDPIKIKDQIIVIRRGQNTESISAVKKIFNL